MIHYAIVQQMLLLMVDCKDEICSCP